MELKSFDIDVTMLLIRVWGNDISNHGPWHSSRRQWYAKTWPCSFGPSPTLLPSESIYFLYLDILASPAESTSVAVLSLAVIQLYWILRRLHKLKLLELCCVVHVCTFVSRSWNPATFIFKLSSVLFENASILLPALNNDKLVSEMMFPRIPTSTTVYKHFHTISHRSQISLFCVNILKIHVTCSQCLIVTLKFCTKFFVSKAVS